MSSSSTGQARWAIIERVYFDRHNHQRCCGARSHEVDLLREQSALSVLFQYRGASLRSESMMYSWGTPTKDGGGNGLGTKERTDSGAVEGFGGGAMSGSYENRSGRCVIK